MSFKSFENMCFYSFKHSSYTNYKTAYHIYSAKHTTPTVIYLWFFIDSCLLKWQTDHVTQHIHSSVSRNTVIWLLYSPVQQLWPKKILHKEFSFIWSSQQHSCIFFIILVPKTKKNHSEMFCEMFEMIHKDISKVL